MDNMSTITHAHLPPHGSIACRRCFTASEMQADRGPWRIVNDPGAWGSAAPRVLVLGFSKGFTQAHAARAGRFEDIPFKHMRPRLTEVLRALGVLGGTEQVDSKMVATERDLAFGSLVRCSLSRFDKAKGKHECTGQIMPRAFVEREVMPIVRQCAEIYLLKLPPSVRLVVLLGTADAYILGCRSLIRSLHGRNFADLNAVAYRTSAITWVHASHPSGLNGHHTSWMAGNAADKQGRKKLLALEAVALTQK